MPWEVDNRSYNQLASKSGCDITRLGEIATLPVVLALCSVLLGLSSLLMWFEARNERRRKLNAGAVGESRAIAALLRAGIPQSDMAFGFLVTGKNGSKAEIDLVVKVGEGAVIVETKNWSGVIEGGSKSQEWVAIKKDGTRIIHGNPISQAARQARILYEATGQATTGIVLMAGGARHTGGKFPDGVTSIGELGNAVLSAVARIPNKHRGKPGAWDKVMSLASHPDAAKEASNYGAFLDSIIGRKPWLSYLALGAVTAAAAIFIEDGTAYSLERAAASLLVGIGLSN